METLQRTVEVNVPVSAAYNQWTQFDDFPRFIEGVEEVRQIDDTHLHWRASIGGKRKEWDSLITKQVRDEVIAWHGTSGPRNAGHIRFEPLGADRTRILVRLEYELDTAVGDAWDALSVSRQIDKALAEFKDFIEMSGRETGAWRGDIPGGRNTGPART